MSIFNIEEARKNGYSDDEIMHYLSASRPTGFDVAGALKSGYTKQEVISYLANAHAAEPQQTPTQPSALESAANIAAIPARLQTGVARGVGQMGMGAVQWAEDLPRQAQEFYDQPGLLAKAKYLTGLDNAQRPSRVTPTPTGLEPSTDPVQRVGETAAKVAIPAMVAPASLPAQAAVGAMTAG